MPPVTPVPGHRKRKPLLTSHILTAAPSCSLQIPSEVEESEVWERLRQASLQSCLHRHLQTAHCLPSIYMCHLSRKI